MRLADPPGVRSCRDGGEWTICRSETGAKWMFAEFTGLEQRLGANETAMVRAELRNMMHRAMDGQLSYGPGPEGQVEQMTATSDVLEMRLSSRSGEVSEDGEEDTLHLRMFFSEPESVPNGMCALMLYWKRPGQVDLADQTASARVASRRLDEWNRSGQGC
jgi:hypothetical protein